MQPKQYECFYKHNLFYYKKESWHIMLEEKIRPIIQPPLNAIARQLVRWHLSANSVSIIAICLGCIAGISILLGHNLIGALFIALSGISDILDGTIARLHNQSSLRGAYIDLVGDRFVEMCIIIAFSIVYPEHCVIYHLVIAAILLHFSTFVGASTIFENTGAKSIHYEGSLIERAEAFIVFIVMACFPGYIFPVLHIFTAAVFITAMTRFFRVLQYARKHNL
jgi:phosphatidylglycerophosphate synthase